MSILLRWLKANSVLLMNASSLIGTTAITSVLGFVYWWVAARQYQPDAVGAASASISAMTLLGGLCMLGLGTLLITEIPRLPGREGELISTALIIVGVVGSIVGVIFALVASSIAPGFKSLGDNLLDVMIFASGVTLTSITLVLDQAFVGLLRGDLQFWRNALFAIAKLVVLFFIGLWLSSRGGVSIYATWAIGNLFSMVALALFLLIKKGWPGRKLLPRWGLLRRLGFAALQHHLLNLTLQAPALILPLLVTALLSPTMNAWFYVAWMLASFVFLIPGVLTIVLHAMNSAQQATLAQKARVTIGLAFIIGLLTNGVLQIATKPVLGLFGGVYADQASWCLRILLLAVFPLTIKNHYISFYRIQDRVTQAMLAMLPGGVLEIVAAALGAYLWGLAGLSAGWVIAIYIQSFFMLRIVYKTIFPAKQSVQVTGALYAEIQTMSLMDTVPLPSIYRSYVTTEEDWNIAVLPTMRVPSIGPVHRVPRRNQWSQQNDPLSPRKRVVKPSRLQPYIPSPSDTPTTDPSMDSQIIDEVDEALSRKRTRKKSTIFEDEMM